MTEHEKKTAELKLFSGGGQGVQPLCAELCERIKGLVYEYGGRLPVAAAIGVLEIAKLEIIGEQK